MITNFFSSGRPTIDETKQTDQLEVSLKDAKEEFKGRKSSKSMQVIQPASSLAFGSKPLDLSEVMKITNLASGLSLIADMVDKKQKSRTVSDVKSNNTQRQSLIELPRAGSSLRNKEEALPGKNDNFVLYASR